MHASTTACSRGTGRDTSPLPPVNYLAGTNIKYRQPAQYLADENVYRCPAGEKLKYRFAAEEHGQKLHVIGLMRAIPARSKLSARREESVASGGGSTRRLSRLCRQGSTKIRTPCGRGARRSSIRSVH